MDKQGLTFTTRQGFVDHWKRIKYKDPHDPKHQNGPDYVLTSDCEMTWLPEGVVKLRMGTSGRNANKPCSIISLVKRPEQLYPDSPALSLTRDGITTTWTYRQYLADIRTAAKGFMKLGLAPLHAVCIIGFNSPEWYLSDLAAIFAGGMATGIYPTNSPQECLHILEDSRANIVVVEDGKQLDKILSIKNKLPHLKAIIQFLGEPDHPQVFKWSDMMEIGRTVDDEALERRIKGISVNQCCTLIYTSGTTGVSKGVMLSHDNITYSMELIRTLFNIVDTQERIISFLPLSHIAAQSTQLYMGIASSSCVYFAQPDALRGSLFTTLKEVRPTRLFMVPRLFEKLHDTIRAKEDALIEEDKKIMTSARKLGYRYALQKNTGSSSPLLGYKEASAVLQKVLEAEGVGAIRSIESASAPLSRDIIEYFNSITLLVRECYGMSEAILQTVNNDGGTKFGTVGRTIDTCETRLHDQDGTGEGEICMRGRPVCMGYLNMEDKTKEAIDEDGWLHSGDLGRMDSDGFLTITGRIKELIITAGGENVAPVPIESRIKKELPIISNAVVVGDRKKFLSVLLTLAVEADPQTLQPTNKLSLAVRQWCQAMSNNSRTVEEILPTLTDAMRDYIQAGINKANEHAMSNAQRVQKWTILPQEFSVNTGELAPTLKLKRQVIHKKYADKINAMADVKSMV